MDRATADVVRPSSVEVNTSEAEGVDVDRVLESLEHLAARLARRKAIGAGFGAMLGASAGSLLGMVDKLDVRLLGGVVGVRGDSGHR
ncbi:hypothetical protein [Candidatus Solirubrobacter pratensis]|uniref:hypothetical protein n=1 Tax=Candidatus Solirubrobacter pratensis TaxID=1298857 RepID=UPI00041C0346|nr:hypothetical protein [Candidatus Solirubrobacter pratensis]